MANNLSLQEQMAIALDNYLALSPILQADMNALLDCETETQQWRRNFIRVSASLIEGYAHCLRELCVGFEFSAGLTTKEKQVLETERGFSADERIKRSLKAAYKHFELPSAPEFGDHNWCVAKPLWAKRDGLMHPKVPAT